MFKDTRAKWVAIGFVTAALFGGSSIAIGQDNQSGFRSTLNRFFGAQPQQASDTPDVEMPDSVDDEPQQATAEEVQKPARSNSGPTSPRGRSSNFRPASTGQSGGLFGGGLFHQLRSVTKSDDVPSSSEDDSAPEATAAQAPASKPTAPSIEPFSKPAVPPPSSSANAIPKSAPSPPSASRSYNMPSNRYDGANSLPNRPAASNGSLPKIVRPDEYLQRSLPQVASNGTASNSAPMAVGTPKSSSTTTNLSTTDINTQLAPLDTQNSSRRARSALPANGSTVMSAKQLQEEQVVAPKSDPSPRGFTEVDDSDAKDALAELDAPADDSVAVSRRTPANQPPNDTPQRAEFMVTSGPNRVAQTPAVPPKTQTSKGTTTERPLPDPISLPPSLAASPAVPSSPAAKPVVPAAKPGSSPVSNYRSPLKDLAQPTPAPNNIKTPPPSTAAPSSESQVQLPNSLYSQQPAARTAQVRPNSATTTASLPTNNVAEPPASNTAAASTTSSNGALMEMEIPQLRLWVEGPEKIRVDRPTAFKIMAKNEGQSGVVGLLVSALVPAGVTASDMKVDAGTIEGEALDDKSQSLLWQLPELAPGQTRELVLNMAASKPENFGLEVEWTVLPQTDVAKVNSIQPQLLIGLEGPSEVLYGKPEVYKLIVRNPGNAPVEEVDIALTSDSFGSKESKLGTIAAGGEKEIEIELTFQNAGELSIQAGASSEKTGLTATSDIKVNVSEVELETACRIPERQYQGAYANYTFTVENIGSVAATNSVCEIALPPDTVVAELPAGMKMVNDKLVWEIASLQPKSENTVDVMLQLNALGEQPVALIAKNSHGDDSTCEAKVIVDTISDLKLTVVDPVAPAPVSENVTYELVIQNRGAKPAFDVAVIAQFSNGIEPTSFTGEEGELVPGQVIFKPIKEIGAGEKVTLTVTAVAGAAGMHRFRAEVQCDNGETHLVQEESTRYLSTAARPTSDSIRR